MTTLSNRRETDVARGTLRVRELEDRLERDFQRRFERVTRQPSGRFEVSGGAFVWLECAAGGAFLCIEAPERTSLTQRWVPTEISRYHERSLSAVIGEAADYVAETISFKIAS